MSRYAREHPDRDPASPTYWNALGASFDRADLDRKRAKEDGPDDRDPGDEDEAERDES